MHPYKHTVNQINDLFQSDAFFLFDIILCCWQYMYVHSSMTIKCYFGNIGCHYKVFIGNIGYHYKVFIWKYRLSLIDIFTYWFCVFTIVFYVYGGRAFLLIWLLYIHFWPESTPPFHQNLPPSNIVPTKAKCHSCTVNIEVLLLNASYYKYIWFNKCYY